MESIAATFSPVSVVIYPGPSEDEQVELGLNAFMRNEQRIALGCALMWLTCAFAVVMFLGILCIVAFFTNIDIKI